MPDPDLDFFTQPGFRIHWVKKTPNPGFGSATLKNVWTPPVGAFFLFLFILGLDSRRIQHLC